MAAFPEPISFKADAIGFRAAVADVGVGLEQLAARPAALEDQQLAGLLMWIPAGVTFIAGGLILFAAWLRESDRHTRYAPVLPAASTNVR